jgi:ABC-type multidrug transport system fused ATPase/permease subunit
MNAPTLEIGLWSGFRQIYGQLSPGRRRQLFGLLALIVAGAVAELATIGAVLPFLALLASPASFRHIGVAASLFEWVGADSVHERLVTVTLLFCAFALIAGIVRLALLQAIQNFVFGAGHELSVEIQRRILLQPYSFHIHRNTSTLLSALEKSDVLIFDLLLPLAQATSAVVISTFIIAGLIYIDPATATVTAVLFLALYLLVTRFNRKPLAANSVVLARSYDERMKMVQESLGGIRDVIIDNSQGAYLRLFDRIDGNLSKARSSTNIIAGAPRYVIETTGMIAIAGLALVMAQRDGGLAVALPVLGAIAIGAQRVLPLLQQIYSAWSVAAGNVSIMHEMLSLLRLPVDSCSSASPGGRPLPLNDRITVEQASFAYRTRRNRTVCDVTVEIPRGAMVALTGATGSGKSTLADLLMGLIEVDQGQILVDGVPLTASNRRSWQRSIAHVPQSVFLSDSSIASNIALGMPDSELDMARVVEAAKTAQIHAFIASLPDSYDTPVGERGVRLSGGQRQRLGIARAIYKQTPVLILDEATSALDDDSEAAVLTALEELRGEGRTIVIIAHRTSTISRCDMVVRLENGRVAEVRTLTRGAEPNSKARSIG